MKAIIIGAGRGIRLMPTTANTPKCFAEVKGRRILDWALAAFRANGLDDIVFIGGYQIDKVREACPEFTFRHHYRQGDVVMWDNRSLMHYAINDYGDQPRYMERTTSIGEKPA